MTRRLDRIASHAVGAGERLVSTTDIKRAQVMRHSDIQAAPSMEQGRLGPAQNGIHPCALPLAPGPMHRLPHLTPVVPAGMRRVQHLVIVVLAAVGSFQKLPDPVEQRLGLLPFAVRIKRHGPPVSAQG